jgi:hypothetical protein
VRNHLERALHKNPGYPPGFRLRDIDRPHIEPAKSRIHRRDAEAQREPRRSTRAVENEEFK